MSKLAVYNGMTPEEVLSKVPDDEEVVEILHLHNVIFGFMYFEIIAKKVQASKEYGETK